MKILFVCEGNMMRSQMGEAIYNQLTGTHDAFSAGALAAGFDYIAPQAAESLASIGISTYGLRSDQLTPQMIEQADKVILFPTPHMPDYAKNSPKAEFWDVADPYYNQGKGMPFVFDVQDDIKRRVKELIAETLSPKTSSVRT